MSDTNIEPPAQGTTADRRLAYLRGKRIVVIDDAFDRPTLDGLDVEAVSSFASQAAESAEAAAEFERVTSTRLGGPTDLTDDMVARLWGRRDDDTELADVARTTLFADAFDKLGNVTPFCDHLRQLGFDVAEVGQAGEIPPGEVALVLVDYVLGPEGRSPGDDLEALRLRAQAVQTSTAVINKYYKSFPDDADKPFIVLMSTRRPGDVLVETFQENSRLLRGTFDFVTKAELCRGPTLEFKLRTWNYSLPSRHQIQHFVEALSSAVATVGPAFQQALRQLSFQDYAYIQGLALQEDGHPLGDYMLWLYTSYLGDLLLSQPQVVAQRRKLDAMEFTAILPNEEPPSVHLAELYQTTIGEPSEPLREHPRDVVDGAVPAGDPPLAYAQLGDVFVKDEHADVYMVLNASCDLAFAPHTGRTCDPDQAILLIPGQLTPLFDAPPDMKLPRTELFEVNKKLFRVIWRDDRVFSLPHRDLVTGLRQTGHERRHRLRLPYALHVQQAFASKLTRVGLPVAPPICIAVDVEAHCADDAGNCRRLCAPIGGGAFIIHRKHKNAFVQEIVLTGKCVGILLDHVDAAADQQTRIPPTPVPPILGKDGKPDEGKQRAAEENRRAGEPAKLLRRKQLVASFKDDHDLWFSLATEPRPLPNAGEPVNLVAGFLSLYREADFAGPWGGRSPIALNVRYGTAARTATGADALGRPRSPGRVPDPSRGGLGEVIPPTAVDQSEGVPQSHAAADEREQQQ